MKKQLEMREYSSHFMESCQSGRSCSTRNAVSLTGPRVRIPDSPPNKPVIMRIAGFLFLLFLNKWLGCKIFWLPYHLCLLHHRIVKLSVADRHKLFSIVYADEIFELSSR